MHSPSTEFSLVFLRPDGHDDESSEWHQLFPAGTVATASSVDTVLDSFGTDPHCVLIDATADGQWAVNAVKTLRDHTQAPLIAFVGSESSQQLSALFQAGVTDVIQSSPASADETLVHRRIETVLDEEGRELFNTTLHYRTLLESAADAIYYLDPDGNFVAANDATAELLGTSRSELLQSNVCEFLNDADISRGKEAIIEQLKNPDTEFHTLNLTFLTATGDEIPCSTRFSTLQVDGEFIGSVGVIRSELEKRAREKRLQERDELLRHLSENLNAVVWVASPSGALEFVSNAAEAFLGHQPTHLFDDEESFVDRIYPEDRERIRVTRRHHATNPEAFDEEYRLRRSDGSVRWVREQWFGVHDEGELTRIVGILQDITEMKERQQELERQREFVQQTHEVAAVAGWELLFDGDVVRWTEEVYPLLNIPPSFEPTLEEILDRYHPEDRKRIEKAYERIQDGEPVRDTEIRIRTGDGEMRWFQLSGELITEEGDPVGIRGVYKDIHDRKQREQVLQNERDLIEQILETSPVGIIVYDTDGKVVRANGQAASVLGLEHGRLLDSTPEPSELTLLSPKGESLDRSDLPFEQIKRTGEPVDDMEVRVVKPTGEEIVLNVDGVPLFDDGEIVRVIIAFDDITERINREKRLKRQRNELAQLDRLNHIIRDVEKALLKATSQSEIEAAVCNNLSLSGKYEYVVALRTTSDMSLTVGESGQHAESFAEDIIPIEGATSKTCPAHKALETGTIQVLQDIQSSDMQLLPTFQSLAAENGINSMVAIPVSYGERKYGILTVYTDARDAFSEREIDVLGELGEIVGHAIAAVESREREETLTALYEATQDLLAAESRWAVSRVVVNAAAEVLSPAGIGIFLYDDEENVLRPAAATDALHDLHEDLSAFGPREAESIIWQAYIDGETKQFADVHESEHLSDPDTAAKQALMIPLGDHGVFSVTGTEYGLFDEGIQRLIGLLAATTEAAFDRIEGQTDIEQRDKELAQRGDRIDRFEDMFSLIGDTDRLLRKAGTRKEIERGICQRLAEMDQYLFAWIGRINADDEVVVPQAWDGENDGYLDTLSFDTTTDEPAACTARSGQPTHISNVTDHLRKEPWAREALDRGYQSMLAVPLTYGEATYGVLTVYADEPNAFNDIVEPVITTLSETIAHSINAIETRRGILADTVVELELELEAADSFLNTVADVADQAVRYREITPDTDSRSQVLFAVSGAAVEEILSLESEFVGVESLTHVEQGDEHLFRAAVAEPTIADTVLECGAIPKSITATATGYRVRVHLPRERDVREFIDRIRDRYPQTTLTSQQTVDSHQTADSLRGTLEDELTDRQREVLVTAYESGYFESPRATSGVELADLLDISQPTMTHHLREAQRRLFTSLFEES